MGNGCKCIGEWWMVVMDDLHPANGTRGRGILNTNRLCIINMKYGIYSVQNLDNWILETASEVTNRGIG